MIPETITIPTAAIFHFLLWFLPSAFLGWLFGIFTTMYTVRRTGYQIVWKQVGKRRWPVMEKIKQETVTSD